MLAAGPQQICIGYSAGAEVAIHAMAQILDDDGTDEIQLVDASNIQITCPEISMYIINTHRTPSRLFTCGGVESLSHEGEVKTQDLADEAELVFGEEVKDT